MQNIGLTDQLPIDCVTSALIRLVLKQYTYYGEDNLGSRAYFACYGCLAAMVGKAILAHIAGDAKAFAIQVDALGDLSQYFPLVADASLAVSLLPPIEG